MDTATADASFMADEDVSQGEQMSVFGLNSPARTSTSGPFVVVPTTLEDDLTAGASRDRRNHMSSQTLERELATYRRLLPELMAEQGKFVLIVADDLLGTFESYSDALNAGYKKAGLTPFLVKRISTIENIAYFTRNLDECRA